MRTFFCILLLATILFTQSCATLQQDVVVRDISINDIAKSLEDRQQAVNSLKAMASVRIETPAETNSFSQATVVKAPDIFRLEILAAFGKTIGVLISDGDRVYLRTSRDQLVFEDSERFNLSYFYPGIPREITGSVLTDILLGKVPFGLWDSTYSVEIDDDTRLIKLSFTNSLNTKTGLLIDPVAKRVEKAVINLYNDRVVDIDYEDFGSGKLESFPKVIRISTDSYVLKLSYVSSLKLNPQIDSDLFKP